MKMAWNNTGYWMKEQPPVLGRVKISFSDKLLRGIYFGYRIYFCDFFSTDMGGLDEFWMDNATARANFFKAKKD